MISPYQKYFPAEVPKKMAQGTLLTLTLGLIGKKSITEALFSGAIAATATLTEAVTRPITKTIFHTSDPKRLGETIQLLLPEALALSAAHALKPWTGGLSYTRTFFFIPYLACIHLNSRAYKADRALIMVL